MTARPDTLRRRAHEALLDITVLRTLIDPALLALDAGLSGWPTTTPGANPGSSSGRGRAPRTIDPRDAVRGDDGLDRNRGAERDALGSDPARRSLEALDEHLRLAADHARAAAVIVGQWAQVRVDATTVTKQLAIADTALWCTNHLRHNGREVRREGGTLCEFCSGFQVQYKRLPPANVLDWRGRGIRLDAVKVAMLLRQTDDANRKKRRAS